ncbi:MAG: hypothetical protein HY587_06875 [Candidatus Omnitrophica bacterium]|nr:hypothetical protein [Candidatus Omnitrophota bacterium]
MKKECKGEIQFERRVRKTSYAWRSAFSLILILPLLAGYSTRSGTASTAAAPSVHNLTRSTELIGERTLNSKTYLNPNGTRTKKLVSGALHYPDSAGKWQDIETNIESTEGDFDFKNVTNLYQVWFRRNIQKAFVQYAVRDHRILYDLPDHPALGTVQLSEAAAKRNEVTYPSVYPGVDLRYTILPGELLEEFIVHDVKTATKIENLDLAFEFDRDVTYVTHSDGSVTFHDPASPDVILFRMPKPVMYELRERVARDGTETRFENYGLHFEILQNGRAFTVKKVLDQAGKEYLLDTDRVYPVVIDATSTYIANDVQAQAYKGGASNGAFTPDTAEFTAGEYAAIDGDDTNFVQTDIATDTKYSYHRFDFTISEAVADITQVDVTWKGFGGIFGGLASFTGDTAVQTSNGPLTIEELYGRKQDGKDTLPDIYFMEKGSITQGHIKEVFKYHWSGDLLTIRLANGKEIKATPHHEFLIDPNLDIYRRADELEVGTLLIAPDGNVVSVTEIDRSTFDGFVYDITVEEFHNYLLGAGIFVHNTTTLDSYSHSLWVKESGTWTSKASGTQTSKQTLTAQYTTNFANIISSGHMHVGAQSGLSASTGVESTSALNSYYVQVLVTSTSSISGTLYTNEAKTTNVGSGVTMGLSLNGGVKSTVNTTAGGAFSFTGLTIAANNAITIFRDGVGNEALYVGQATDSNNIIGIEMYTDKIVLSHNTAGPMTNTLLATADNSADDDIAYTISGAGPFNVTFNDGFEVWIESAKTYTPGGTVTADDLEVRGTGTFAPEANAVTMHGDWTMSATGTFTISADTAVTFAGTGSAADPDSALISGGKAFKILVIDAAANGSTYEVQLSTNAVTADSIRIADGELDLNNLNLTDTSTNPAAGAAGLELSGATSKLTAGSATLDLNSTFNLTAGSADLGSATINLDANWTNAGTTITEGTSTVVVGADGIVGNFTITHNSKSFFNFTVNHTQALASFDDVIIAAGTFDVNGTLTLTDGTFDTNTSDPTIQTAGNIVVQAASNTNVGSGTWTIDGNSTVTVNATSDPFDILTINNGATAILAGSLATYTVTNLTITNGNLDWATNNKALTITGNISIGASGATTPSASTTVTHAPPTGTTKTITNAAAGTVSLGNFSLTPGNTTTAVVQVQDSITFKTIVLASDAVAGAQNNHFKIIPNDATAVTATVTDSITLQSNTQFAELHIDATNGNVTLKVGSTITNSSGSFIIDNSANTIILEGSTGGNPVDFTTTGLNFNTKAVTFKNVDYQVALSLSGAGNTLTLGDGNCEFDAVTIGASAILSDGGFAFKVSGNWDNTNGDYTSSGTVTFNGTTDQTITTGGTTATKDFTNVTLNNTGTSPNNDVIISGNLLINGDLTITAGDLDWDTNDPTITLAGNIAIGASGTTTPSTTSTVTHNHTTGTTVTLTNAAASTVSLGIFTINALGSTSTAPVLEIQDSITFATLTLPDGQPTVDQSTKILRVKPNDATAVTVTADTIILSGSTAKLDLDAANGNVTLSVTTTITNTGGSLKVLNSANIVTVQGNGGLATLTGSQIAYNGQSVTLKNIDHQAAVNLSASGDTIVLGDGNCKFGNITIQFEATFNAGANNFEVSGNFNNASAGATFTHTGGTATFNAGATGKTLKSSGDSFANLTFNNAAGSWLLQDALTVTSDLTLTAGTLDADSNGNTAGGDISDINVGGNWSNSGIFNERTDTVTFNGAAAQTLTGETFYNLTVANTAATPSDTVDVDSSAAVTVTNALAVNDGQFQPTTASSFKNVTIASIGILKPDASASITVSGNFTNSGTFTHNSGTVTFNGSAAQTLTGDTFNNLTINNTAVTPSDTIDVDPSAAVTVSGTLNVNDGQFQPHTASSFAVVTIGAAGILKPDASATITVSGDFTNSGTFTHSSGTVDLSTGSQTLSGNFNDVANSRFNNLTKVVTTAATLTLEDTGIYQVIGSCTLKGATGQLLTVTSDDGTQTADFDVIAGGTIDLNYLNAVRIDSADNLLMIAPNSTITSCVNWQGAATGVNFTWDGSTSTAWNIASNWDRGTLPATDSNVTIVSASNDPILDTARTMNNLTINALGVLSLNGNNLTLAGTTFENGGTLKLQGDETINFGAGGAAMDTNSGTFEYVGGGDGTYAVTDGGTATYYDLKINKVAEIFLLSGALTVNNDLTLTAGTLDTDSNGDTAGGTVYDVTAKGNVNLSGTFKSRTSKLWLFADGVNEIKTLTTGGNALFNLDINHFAITTNTARISGALNIDGDFTLSDGVLDLDTNNVAVNVAGNVTIVNGANVTPDQTGPWTFDGTTQTYTDSNATKQDLGVVVI